VAHRQPLGFPRSLSVTSTEKAREVWFCTDSVLRCQSTLKAADPFHACPRVSASMASTRHLLRRKQQNFRDRRSLAPLDPRCGGHLDGGVGVAEES
jgi:hypothetical protein